MKGIFKSDIEQFKRNVAELLRNRLKAGVILGASAGGLLLYVYHAWAVRHGCAAWSVLLWVADKANGSETALSSPPWRRLWPWILASFVTLVAGIALGVVGSTLVEGLR